ncbi:MAG: hypothetical protein U0L42_04040 [Methanobrevibacter sp.]|uniref:hypothetical protein n=1 Tax=Methanobrevibacter sp. TaxID=66852 RepID=UPI002E799CA1|nr:hypothetical protein [Methanobrevibacter sp.]MEE0934823.1 hypothetical protein [Methanobrevibacter sp.]
MKIDSKGNLILGTTVILITILLLIAIFVFTAINYIQNENIDSLENDNFKHVVDDYSNNLEVLGRDSIADACDKVYHTYRLLDSEDQIKKNLNKKLDKKNEEFKEKYDVDINSEALSVLPTDSPWKVLIKVKLNVKKNNDRFNRIIEKNVSIEGLRDPLPLAKLSVASGVFIQGDKLNYKNALTRYLKLRNLDSPFSYAFATTPLYIKKCPYDPYIHHGDPGVLKDCLKQGYFHESADGSCYLCRLEGKGKCPHYGMEVFIQTHTPLINDSISCSDHVVFHDHYTGHKIDKLDIDSLILDSSHQKKYGLYDSDDGQ